MLAFRESLEVCELTDLGFIYKVVVHLGKREVGREQYERD